jgi:aspartate/methionine/tyrosine aminotransferase
MIIELADRLKDVKPYYFVKKLEQVRQMMAEGKDVINFGIGSPDLAPSQEAKEACVAQTLSDQNHGYQAYAGIPELRRAMADFYQKTYSVTLNPNDEVLPLMGSKEGILHLLLAFANAGDKILVPNPGYPTYSSLAKLLGVEIEYYDLKEENGWYPDFEEIEKKDLSRVKMFWMNYPHMPTGTPAKLEIFEKAVKFAQKHKILICHDNPYSLVLNQKAPTSIFLVDGAKEVAVELNSLSKSHNMAGWRVGMILGDKEYISNVLRVKSNIDSGMYRGLQSAAIAALGADENWHKERNEIYDKRKSLVYKVLDKLDCEYTTDQEGMFVWAKPRNPEVQKDIPAFIDKILDEKHVFITPGMIFGSNGNGYIRLSLCVKEQDIQKALLRF